MMGNAGKMVRRGTGILLILFVLLFITPVSAAPAIPAEYYGQVYINGNPAPVGTVISATINNVVVSSIQTTEVGLYGGAGTFDPRLRVIGDTNGQTIIFLINGKQADKSGTFISGTSNPLSLSDGNALAVALVTLPASPQATQITTPLINPTQSPNPTPSTTTIVSPTTTAGSPTTTVTLTIQQSSPMVTDTATISPTSADKQKVTPSASTNSAATSQPSATASTPGFSFQTVGLFLIVITLGAILRK